MEQNSCLNARKSPATVLADADLLVEKGDAMLNYLEYHCNIDTETCAEIFREAGLGFGSHRMNGEDLGYRDQLDIEIVGNALSLQEKTKDRNERLQLIHDAIDAVAKKNWPSEVDKVVAYIRNERPSRITMEHSPGVYRESIKIMTQDLIKLLTLKGISTTLGPEDIIRFFGAEENTFHKNFEQIFAEVCTELDLDLEVELLPVCDPRFAPSTAYTFRFAN